MAVVLSKNWSALAFRGALAIIFAILTFVWPGITLTVLVLLFGIYALIDGVLAIVSTIRAVEGHRRWGEFLFEGIVGILAGVFTFISPGITLAFLVIVIAVWAIVTGVMEILAAFRLRKHIAGEWLLALVGVISVIFGIALFIEPFTGAVVLVWWLAGYMFVFGFLLLILAFRLRGLHSRLVV